MSKPEPYSRYLTAAHKTYSSPIHLLLFECVGDPGGDGVGFGGGAGVVGAVGVVPEGGVSAECSGVECPGESLAGVDAGVFDADDYQGWWWGGGEFA